LKNFILIICFFIVAGCATENKVKIQKVHCGLFEKPEKCKARKLIAKKEYEKAVIENDKKKLSKDIKIDEFKKEKQAEIDKIAAAGPSIDFINEKKPRRALSKINVSGNNGVYKPNSPSNKISINFKKIRLSKALTALGSMGDKNIIISDKVSGYLTLNIENTPWNEVFNSVVEMNNLVVMGSDTTNILKIYSSTEGMSGSSSKITEVFNIFYETPSLIKAQLDPFFAAQVKTDSSDAVDAILSQASDENKTLLVQGTVAQVNKIEELLNTLDVKKPQILIEAFLVEVTPTFTSKLGTRLGLGATRTETSAGGTQTIVNVRGAAKDAIDAASVGVAGDELKVGENNNSVTNFLVAGTSGLGIIAKTSTQQLKFEIDALETEGITKTLSNPKLFTVSGKNAIISQGQEIAIAETTTVDGVTSTVSKIYNAALMLNITPTITGDGTVELKMLITNDTITSTVAPITITTKSVDTNVVLNDGDIAVVGGILTQTRSKNVSRVPGLGKIPLIGALFRSNAKVDDNVELLIFIAPRII